ncbi:SpoIIE family protein phosphatase [Yinghuangia sp. ASG 101]|uniref:ATP-binding SpoIIE family protein phosphatase n=1 Tax=Yinghuangia sp. ASG 101 TaxID=2896848 RepID=UPI001E41C830|nr:SpoIIE family protein phosphatase [Yinghuangia sp. ASG 101]UGQ12248.1 SpoIIE family protein phosphatase [Yinghuangia sp. ASG 101]
MFDLAHLTPSDLVVCGSDLRQATASAATTEEAAYAVARHLRGRFADPATKTPQVALARVYATARVEGCGTTGCETPTGGRVLELLGGDGESVPEAGHPGQPELVSLTSPTEVAQLHPAFASVLRDLGILEPEPPDHPDDARSDRNIAPSGPSPADAAPNDPPAHASSGSPGSAARPRVPVGALGVAILDEPPPPHADDAAVPPGAPVVDTDPDADADSERHAIAHIPDPLAARHGVRTVLGYAGHLPDGERFAVLLFTGAHVPASTAVSLRGLTAATRLALLPVPSTPVPTPRTGQLTAARLDALEQLLSVAEDRTVEQARTVESYRGRVRTQAEQLEAKQRRLEQERQIVETLYNVGQQLTRELDLDQLVQVATDAATAVIAAEHGILLYRDCDTDGHDDIRHAATTRGSAPHPLLPHPDVRLTGAHLAVDTVRCRDVADHPGEWHRAPLAEDAEAPTVRSYLAVPVVSRTGERVGSFAFSHSKPDIFTQRDEQLALGIASQAASAIENARLYRSVADTAVRLQRSLLPPELPDIETLEIACRYLPGARGSQVGGDWFDVIPLSAGRVALVIGDVMGRGLTAAAVMGQLRTAVRAYAVMDLPPAQVMRHLNRLMGGMGAEDQITTCVYAVYDPDQDLIRWSNAGHLPPAIISSDGEVRLLDDDLGVPLGVDGTAFEDADAQFRAGDRLLLYTDGLVERHDVSLADRLLQFTEAVDGAARNPGGVQDTCDRLMSGMLTGREHDDVALLLVRAQAGRERAAALELPPTPRAAREARVFARAVLGRWRRAAVLDGACSVVTELVANAVEHARTPMELRLSLRPGRLVVQVADHDGRLPRRLAAGAADERHRGLMIVNALSADWGTRPTDTGKVVWAELPDPG